MSITYRQKDGPALLKVPKFAGAKKILILITSVSELGTVLSNLIGAFGLIFYSTAQEAVFKVSGVE
jgi:ATP-dependent Lon protease